MSAPENTIPPAEAGPAASTADGVPTRPESVQDGDTLVFVVDVVAVSVKDAVGAAETPQLPVTLGEAEGKPTVTIDTASTPPAVISALEAAAQTALADPEVRGKLGDVGIEAAGGSADRLREFIRNEIEIYAPVVKAANMKAD